MNPLWTLCPPLAAMCLILLFGERHRNLREGSIILAGLWLLHLNGELYHDVLDGVAAESGELAMLAGFGLKLSAEPIGVMFGLLASFLWVVTTVYSIGYMRGHDESNQTRFYFCFAIALGSVMAAAYADNLLTLFVAYEVLSLSTYPLVTHSGSEKAKKAGRVYLGILMSSSIGLFLPAIIWIATLTGTLEFRAGGILSGTGLGNGALALMLALFVFGIAKAAVMPLHRWLPAAMVAPTPVSALLHAVAVVKTGVFCLLKIVTYTFGIDTVAASGAANLLLPFTAFTIIAASIVAFTRDNLKARLAYSTVSQLSYIVMAALLASAMSVSGGTLHMVMHAFGKITLFFCAGAIMVALHKTEISELDGIGRQMPITMGAFFIAAVGIIGLPPVGGSWSKLLIAGGAMESGTVFWAMVLMFSTLLNIAYLLPIPLRAFFGRADAAHHDDQHSEVSDRWGLREAPMPSLWAIVLTTLACILLFFFPEPLTALLGQIRWR